MNTKKWIGKTLIFSCFYTLLFFCVSNYLHWYFNGEFLYAELLGETGYYLYNWLGNIVTTVTMAVILFVSELLRNRVSARN